MEQFKRSETRHRAVVLELIVHFSMSHVNDWGNDAEQFGSTAQRANPISSIHSMD
jgi:hypothetical protein